MRQDVLKDNNLDDNLYKDALVNKNVWINRYKAYYNFRMVDTSYVYTKVETL